MVLTVEKVAESALVINVLSLLCLLGAFDSLCAEERCL